MLTYSNLNEAAEELSRRTGRIWTEKEVLDFAWHVRIPLAAATPVNSVVVTYRLRDEDGRICFKEWFRKSNAWAELAYLAPGDIMSLMNGGESMLSRAKDPSVEMEDQMTLFEPAVKVTVADVRVVHMTLKNILRLWAKSQAKPVPLISRAGTDGTGHLIVRHRWPDWVVDHAKVVRRAPADVGGPKRTEVTNLHLYEKYLENLPKFGGDAVRTRESLLQLAGVKDRQLRTKLKGGETTYTARQKEESARAAELDRINSKLGRAPFPSVPPKGGSIADQDGAKPRKGGRRQK